MSQEQRKQDHTPDVESVRTDDRGRWEDDGGNSQVRGVPGYRPDAEGRPDLPGPRPVGPHGDPVDAQQRTVRDEGLRAAALEALGGDPELLDETIGCRCEDGVITLTGTVSEPAVRDRALRAVAGVEGARAVRDEIRVPVPGS